MFKYGLKVIIYMEGSGSSKCFAKNTNILMYDGTIKKYKIYV